jgi:site-specific recombinase XerD
LVAPDIFPLIIGWRNSFQPESRCRKSAQDGKWSFCLTTNERIWRFSRTTAWRRVKEVMQEAGIAGTPAMPKGLRHGFGVNAFQSYVPPHLVQRWMGHASLRTTAIYGDVMGPEERGFAERMWTQASS